MYYVNCVLWIEQLWIGSKLEGVHRVRDYKAGLRRHLGPEGEVVLASLTDSDGRVSILKIPLRKFVAIQVFELICREVRVLCKNCFQSHKFRVKNDHGSCY